MCRLQSYKASCQQSLNLPPHNLDQSHSILHFPHSPASKQSKKCPHSTCSQACVRSPVPLLPAFPLNNDSWQILRRKQHPSILPTSSLIFTGFLLKQSLQTYLCDVIVGSKAVNMPCFMSAEFDRNKSQINTRVSGPNILIFASKLRICGESKQTP